MQMGESVGAGESNFSERANFSLQTPFHQMAARIVFA